MMRLLYSVLAHQTQFTGVIPCPVESETPVKKKMPFPGIPAADAEEFFRLPRMEDLLAEHRGDLGARVVNNRIQSTERFSMAVGDNHMSRVGLSKGDNVVVQRQAQYDDGDIVAVRLGEKTTIRRYFRVLQRIRLETADPDAGTTIVDFTTPGFAILGKVVQVIRVLE